MASTTSNSLTVDDLHLGFWTNWTLGAVRGATLTLTRGNGALLTAFLAVFVTLTGTCFWRICCFLIHYSLSSQFPKDGIHHQRQAVLRNSASAMSGFWNFLRIYWAWRSHDGSPLKILLLAICALVTVTVFTAAGVFSSRITLFQENEVLLTGSSCAIWDFEQVPMKGYMTEYYPYKSQQLTSTLDYARTCYGPNGGDTRDCRRFVQDNLRYKVRIERNAACPFPGGDKICLLDNRNIELDTGLLDSNTDLGINAAPEHRFLYRSVTKCSPLRIEEYSVDESIGNTTTVRFDYGPQRPFNYTYDYTQKYAVESEAGYGESNTALKGYVTG